jgi:hypothetical protein
MDAVFRVLGCIVKNGGNDVSRRHGRRRCFAADEHSPAELEPKQSTTNPTHTERENTKTQRTLSRTKFDN